jgi:hypothetical protein
LFVDFVTEMKMIIGGKTTLSNGGKREGLTSQLWKKNVQKWK